MQQGFRRLSAYSSGQGVEIWFITESSRQRSKLHFWCLESADNLPTVITSDYAFRCRFNQSSIWM